ncbi:DUF742 domain-containing protein, partial [Streptomyces nigra]
MTAAGDGPWLDDAAGRLVRPFTVSNGRTRPTVALDLMSQVMATGATPLGYLGPEHEQALDLCRAPVSIAEVAAHLKLPAAVTKVLLSDLVDCGARGDRLGAALRQLRHGADEARRGGLGGAQGGA